MCFSVEEENPEFWRSKATQTLQSVLDRKLNTNVAKNVILFLGDGKFQEAQIFPDLLLNNPSETDVATTMKNQYFPYFLPPLFFSASEHLWYLETHWNIGSVNYSLQLECMQTFVLCASGMGITTYTAARILKGQLQDQTGEETVMTMDTFPHVGLAKVCTAQ